MRSSANTRLYRTHHTSVGDSIPKGGTLAADFFSAVTTLGTPLDVTLQEIRIECFFPANEQTAAKSAAGYN